MDTPVTNSEKSPVTLKSVEGNTIIVDVGGHSYSYEPKDDRTVEEILHSFKGIMKHSPWKALNWLRKNAKLSSGGVEPKLIQTMEPYERADYVHSMDDLVEYLLEGLSVDDTLETMSYLSEQVAMIHPRIKSMNDLLRETILMLNNSNLIKFVVGLDDYPEYSILYISGDADKAKMAEFVQDLGWISQESKLVLTPADETEDDIPVDKTTSKNWVFILAHEKLPENLITKVRTGGEKQRVTLQTKGLPSPQEPTEAPSEGDIEVSAET